MAPPSCNLCKFVNSLCFGSVAEEVVPFFCGAALTTLRKKAGGVRPFAVGEVLISKCIAQPLSSEFAEILPPLQLGVGVKMGCESIVHTVNSILDDNSIANVSSKLTYAMLLTP